MELPQKIGNYLLLEVLGRGGMGEVYKATDLRLQRTCALKIIRSNETDQKVLRRFIKEARAIGALSHPNIVMIYEIETSPQYFFSMEYVPGKTLSDFVKKKELTWKSKLQIFVQICQAIEYAHSQNIIHRDIKPDNVMVSEEGIPKVMDFGIAKHLDQEQQLTQTGELVGTPKYIAPELADGEKSSKKSDIYSLGVVLYQLLLGRVPFDGDTVMEIFYQIIQNDPVPPSHLYPSLPKELDIISLKALEKKPENRYTSVSFLRKEVERVLENKPIRTKPPSTVVKLKKWCQRNVLATSVIFILLVLAGTFTLVSQKINRENKNLLKREKKLSQDNETLVEREEKLSEDNSQLKNKENELKNEIAQLFIREAESKINVRNYVEASNALEKAIKNINSAQKDEAYIDFLGRYSMEPCLPKSKAVLSFPLGQSNKVSSEGKYFASIHSSHLYLWNIKDLVVGQRREGKIEEAISIPGQYSALYFSPDENLLALVSYNAIDLWNLSKRKRVSSFTMEGEVKGIEISNNNSLMMIVHEKKMPPVATRTALWSLGEKPLLLMEEFSNDSNSRVSFSEDSTLAFVMTEKTIFIWDIKQRKILGQHNQILSRYKIIKCGRGKTLFLGDEYGNIQTYEVIKDRLEAKNYVTAHKNNITHLVFQKNSRFCASASIDKKVHIWDMVRLQKYSTIPSNNLVDMHISASKLGILSKENQALKYELWQLEPLFHKQLNLPFLQKKLFKLLITKASQTSNINIFPYSPVIISSRKNFVAVHYWHYILLWKNDKFWEEIDTHTFSEIVEVLISKDEKWLATRFRNNSIHVRNLSNLNEHYSVKMNADTKSFAFDSQSHFLICGSNADLLIWDFQNNSLLPLGTTSSGVRSLAFSPDNHWLAIGKVDGLEVWQVHGGNILPLGPKNILKEGALVKSIAWFQNSLKLFSGDDKGKINLYQWRKPTWEEQAFEEKKENFFFSPIEKLSLSPDEKNLAIFSNNQVLLQNLEHGFLTHLLPGQFIGDSASLDRDWKSLAFSTLNGSVVFYQWPDE